MASSILCTISLTSGSPISPMIDLALKAWKEPHGNPRIVSISEGGKGGSVVSKGVLPPYLPFYTPKPSK